MTNLRPTARVARGATFLFIQGFTNAVIGIIYFIVLAHALSVPEVGVFTLLVFVLSIPQIFGIFALPQAAVKYISQYLAENNPDKAKSVIVRVLQVGLAASAISFFLLFIPAEGLSALLFATPQYALVLRLVAITAVFSIMNVLFSSFLQGLQKMSEVAALGLAYTLIQNSVGIFLLYSGWGLYAVVLGWLSGLTVAAIAGMILTAQHLGIMGQPHQVRPLLQFSLPLYASGAIGYLVQWVDQLLLVSYLSLTTGGPTEAQRQLGIYRVAVQAASVPSVLSTSIVTALFPQLSELYAQRGLSSIKDAFRVSTRYLVLVGFPLVIGLATLAQPAIILFAGQRYIQAAEPLVIISIAALVGIVGVAASPILMTLERTNIVSVLSLVSVVLSAFLSYFTLAFLGLGMIGTAWARTIAAVVGLALSLLVLARYVPISFDKEALWKGALASAFMVAAIIGLDLVRKSFSSASYQFLVIRLTQLPIYVVFGAFAYSVALIALRTIKKNDVELIEEYLPQKLKPIAAWLNRVAVVD